MNEITMNELEEMENEKKNLMESLAKKIKAAKDKNESFKELGRELYRNLATDDSLNFEIGDDNHIRIKKVVRSNLDYDIMNNWELHHENISNAFSENHDVYIADIKFYTCRDRNCYEIILKEYYS